MENLFTLENIWALAMLIFLQAILGFDNLLYISIESKRAPEADQKRVRRMGILIAVGLRIVLLFVMINLIDAFQKPLLSFHGNFLSGEFDFGALIFILGGVFIMYTAVKEIIHMLSVHDLEHEGDGSSRKTAGQAITMIVLMNLIFSFDSILSALAISDVFLVLATAIIISGVLMLLLADTVSEFLKKNRLYEVLGLFILLIVGVYLLGEGGHQAHMKIAGFPVVAMSKVTFYFSIVVLVLVDLIQTRYQKKLMAAREIQDGHRNG